MGKRQTQKKEFTLIFLISVTITLTVFTVVVVLINNKLRHEIRNQILSRDAQVIYQFTLIDQVDQNHLDLPDRVSSWINRNSGLTPSLWSSNLQGILALQLFDPNGKLLSTIPASMIPADLKSEDLNSIRNLSPISRFHPEIWMDSLFSDPRMILGDAAVPLLEIIIPIHRENSNQLDGIAQYWVDGRNMAKDLARLDKNIWNQTWIALGSGYSIILLILVWASVRLKKINRDLVSEVEQRRSTEETLRDSERRYRQIFDNVLTPYFEASADGILLDVSPSVEKITQYSRTELIGRNLLDFVRGSEKQRHLLRTFRSHRELLDEEIQYVDKDGSRIYSIICLKEIAEDGKIIGSILNISKLKKAENEILKIRNQLNTLFNSIPSMIVSVDKNLNVVNWNKKATKITGISEEEAKGRLFNEILPEYKNLVSRVTDVIRSGESEQESIIPRYSGGKTFYDNVSIAPLIIDSQGGAVVRIDDITDRIRLEQMSIQNEKMMTVGGLAAGMAHELNNPLAAILQGAQNVIRRLSPDLEMNNKVAENYQVNLNNLRFYLEERKIIKNLEGIRDSGIRAAKIITNMLLLSRNNMANSNSVDINSLLEGSLQLALKDYDLKANQSFKDIQIIKDFENNLDTIPCVESEIEQVILNLLNNAAQALNGNGQKKPQITIRTRKTGDMIQIEVEDNGPGMDESTRKRVFEPFFTTKPIGEGTGLGLSVSYMIVTGHHNGFLEVDSRLGEGTRFTISLPCVKN